MEMPPEIQERLKRIHFELIDTTAEVQKAHYKLDVTKLFETDLSPKDREKLGYARDISDHYIRMGSLIRRICDLVEPYTEEKT